MAGDLLTRNVALIIKEEAAPGVDAVPTSLANSILAAVSAARPVIAETADRKNIMPHLGSPGKVAVAVHSEIDIEVELAGASAAGTVPGWGALLKACGFSETIVAAASVTYAPVSKDFKTVSIYYHLDGVLHKMIGSMGVPTFNLNAKTIPIMAFKFTGLYSTTTDLALPTDSDFSAFLAPVAVNKVNTTAFTLHGISTPFDTFSINGGGQVVYRNAPNQEDVIMTGRQMSGGISIPSTVVATKDWGTEVKDGILAPFSMTHGSVAGNTFTISAPKVQLVTHGYGDKEGVSMTSFDLDLQPNTGNDELIITIT